MVMAGIYTREKDFKYIPWNNSIELMLMYWFSTFSSLHALKDQVEIRVIVLIFAVLRFCYSKTICSYTKVIFSE